MLAACSDNGREHDRQRTYRRGECNQILGRQGSSCTREGWTMTTPLSTGSVPLADYIDSLRWLKDALKWLDGVNPDNDDCDGDTTNTRLSRAFLELYPNAAVQLDLLASIDNARERRAQQQQQQSLTTDAHSDPLRGYDDARR